jgi:hypothetical protein
VQIEPEARVYWNGQQFPSRPLSPKIVPEGIKHRAQDTTARYYVCPPRANSCFSWSVQGLDFVPRGVLDPAPSFHASVNQYILRSLFHASNVSSHQTLYGIF